MIDARRSVLLAVSAERKRHWIERQKLRDEMLRRADAWTKILDERDAALGELHELKTRIARANAQRAEIGRLRAFTAFAIAQRDPTMLLH
jgi:hypothetical protein